MEQTQLSSFSTGDVVVISRMTTLWYRKGGSWWPHRELSPGDVIIVLNREKRDETLVHVFSQFGIGIMGELVPCRAL